MTDEQPPMRPQDQTNFLLGQLTGQVGSLQSSVESNTSTQADLNNSFRAGIEKAQSTADRALSQTEMVAQRIPSRTPWYQIGSGLAGFAALVLAAIALLPNLLR
jgi:hypothetical protein